MSIYKIKGTFLSTEEGRDDKNACGARKKGGVFFIWWAVQSRALLCP